MVSLRRMKAISPVIAAVVLIGVAIAGALLLGYYMTTSIKSSSPKGTAIAVSDVELYYLGRYKVGYSWKYHYLISVKIARTIEELLNIDFLKKTRTNVEIYGLLMVLSGWARFFGEIIRSANSSQHLGSTIIKISSYLHNLSVIYIDIVGKLMNYITIYGLALFFTYPTYIYLPPEVISM